MKFTSKFHSREHGFSLIELMIVIAIIGILIGVGVPAWRSAVRTANEASAIQTLRTIASEQVSYYNSHNRSQYGTFDQMVKDGMLNDQFTGDTPVVSGYIFTMKVTPKSTSQQPSYSVNADPQQSEGISATGHNHYFLDSGVSTIHVNDQQQASATDPSLGK